MDQQEVRMRKMVEPKTVEPNTDLKEYELVEMTFTTPEDSSEMAQYNKALRHITTALHENAPTKKEEFYAGLLPVMRGTKTAYWMSVMHPYLEVAKMQTWENIIIDRHTHQNVEELVLMEGECVDEIVDLMYETWQSCQDKID